MAGVDKLCHFRKLWREKCRFADELRVLQPNTPFRAQGFATQHSLWWLKVLVERNIPFRLQGVAIQHSFWDFSTPFGGLRRWLQFGA